MKFKLNIPLNIKALFILSASVIGFAILTIIIVSRFQDKKIESEATNVIETSMSTESAYNAKYYLAESLHYIKNIAIGSDPDSAKKAQERFSDLERYLNEMVNAPSADTASLLKELTDKKSQLAKLYSSIKDHTNGEADKTVKELYQICAGLEKTLDDFIAKMFDKKLFAIEHMQTAKAQMQILNISISVSTILISLLAFIIMYFRIKPLDQIIKDLSAQADMVNSASSSVGKSAEELQMTSSQQSSAAVETAAALEQITQMASRTADLASNLKNNVESSTKAVSTGTQMVTKMVSSMDHIEESNRQVILEVNDSNQQIREILGVISDIAEKTRVINDIVFQTKLLSFNASVEAARAGEAGKGFAVVAQEIGNLAAMSGQAAQAISSTLSNGLGRVEQIIDKTKQGLEDITAVGKDKIREGSQNAIDCGKSFDIVSTQISEVSTASQEIFHAIKEQSIGLGEISSAISVFDKSSHKNATASEKTLETAKTLLNQAHHLNQLVIQLNAIATGKEIIHEEDSQENELSSEESNDFQESA